jgi:branched-chain amino acid transport system substrate-binding protein
MERSSKKMWAWVVAGIVVVVGVVWWGASRNNANADTITIGSMFPLTGDAAVYGEPSQKSVQLAVDAVNAQGGINGKQLKVVFQDSQCTGQGGTNAAQELINIEKVQVIIGGFCSGETIPAVPVAAAQKVLVFSPGASSPKLTGISPYFFRDDPSDAAQAGVYAKIAANNKHWKTVGVIEEQTDYATALNDTFNKDFAALGGKTVSQAFPTNTTDFRSVITTLKAQKPDAVFIDIQTPAALSRILDQMKQLGWNPPLIVNDVISGDPATLTQFASQLEGAVTAEFLPNASDTKYMAFIDAYKNKYGSVPPYQNYMSAMYDSVLLLAEGIKQVGYNGQALAAWSRTITNWDGASGSITIGADGDRVSGHVPLLIHNGDVIPFPGSI